jgi:hypothetical protein
MTHLSIRLDPPGTLAQGDVWRQEPHHGALSGEQVPFIFVSGSNPLAVPAELRHAPFISEPFDEEDIREGDRTHGGEPERRTTVTAAPGMGLMAFRQLAKRDGLRRRSRLFTPHLLEGGEHCQ